MKKVLLRKAYAEEGYDHMEMTLCKYGDKFVTWAFNKQFSGYAFGHYFDTFEAALINYNGRGVLSNIQPGENPCQTCVLVRNPEDQVLCFEGKLDVEESLCFTHCSFCGADSSNPCGCVEFTPAGDVHQLTGERF